MPHTSFNRNQAVELESLFFKTRDSILIDQLKKLEEMKQTKEDLAKVSGIKDDAVLEKLVELGICPDVMAVLSAVPLIEVAWADGEVDEKERQALLQAVESLGIEDGSVEHEILERWLDKKPDSQLLEAWSHYIEAICQSMSEKERTSLQAELMGNARKVAEASGGFLGLGSKISKSERAVLEQLEKAFAG